MALEREYTLLDHVDLAFDEVEVFKDLTLKIPASKITCIIGPSGCGKTSILNLLSGIVSASKGSVSVENKKVGYIFQEDRLLPWETVYQNVKLVRREEDNKAIMGLLKALELDDFKDKYPHQLSGGMRQRCAIARGFYYNATLLLMDEPFKSLDYDLRLNLIQYLIKLWEEKQNAIIFVTHDIDEALLLGHHIIVLSNRPSRILATYDLEKSLCKRKINDEQHITIRSEIINQLSQERKI